MTDDPDQARVRLAAELLTAAHDRDEFYHELREARAEIERLRATLREANTTTEET